jgi:GT2 family glycosyltransferase
LHHRGGNADSRHSMIADRSVASVIVLNWNGRHLLQESLPALVAAVEHAGGGHEVIVVDDGSADGSAEYVAREFPKVQLVALARNLGFGRAANHGVAAARNDIVALLNNDMIVEPEFLPPLLEHFRSPEVFAVASMIRMPPKVADGQTVKETGLTRGAFAGGFVRIWQEQRPAQRATPVFYAGGGSSAYDRRKFLALGGFDRLYHPFYYEDVDLSYVALKRGWRILMEPRSLVTHKHRGTINARNFRPSYIRTAVLKNELLFHWKNLTDAPLVARHLAAVYVRLAAGGEALFPRAFVWALRQLPQVLARRAAGRAHARLTDAAVVSASSSPHGATPCRD